MFFFFFGVLLTYVRFRGRWWRPFPVRCPRWCCSSALVHTSRRLEPDLTNRRTLKRNIKNVLFCTQKNTWTESAPTNPTLTFYSNQADGFMVNKFQHILLFVTIINYFNHFWRPVWKIGAALMRVVSYLIIGKLQLYICVSMYYLKFRRACFSECRCHTCGKGTKINHYCNASYLVFKQN